MNNPQNYLEKYRGRIYKVLAEQNFIIGKREKKNIEKGILSGRRYFFMVAKRIEGKKIVERFIKIPQNDTKKLLVPFERQIEVANFIKKNKIIDTRGVINFNYNPKKGIPFAIMETFPINKSRIGFIEKNKGVELLGAREARHMIKQLKKFHSIPYKTLPLKLRNILKPYPADYERFEKKMFKHLNQKVRPLELGGKPIHFYKLLEQKLEITDIKNKTKKLLASLKPIIDSKKNQDFSIVHGDLSPNNLYVFDSGRVEFLDLEWAGLTKNKAIAMIRDFGNFRARSWKNKKFRKALDAELIKSYESEGQKELGKAIVQLATLRSHLLLSGAFENYDHVKQKNKMEINRKESTESDLVQIFNI